MSHAVACVRARSLACCCHRLSRARAQLRADFYKGKTITILMGTGPGGSYDLYGRTIAEHLGQATSPAVRTSWSSTCRAPAASSPATTSTVPAPQDGSKILLSHALPLVERMSPKGVQFESREDALARRL